VIDLSRRSAALLGMKEQGIAPVRIDVIGYPFRKAPVQVTDAKR
jgi:rare lipoprotein A (peptidoglycan hydrolase)